MAEGRQGVAIAGSLLARNTALNGVGQILPVLAAVVAIPPVVVGLGESRFGVLAIAWMVLGYFTELGFGRATTKYVAEVLGRGEMHRLGPIMWATVITQALLGVVAGIGLALAVPLLVTRLLNIPPQLGQEALRSFYVVAWAVPVVLLSSAFRGVLEAAQRFDLVNLVRVPSAMATTLLPLLGVALGWDLPGIVMLLLVARIGATVSYFTLAAFRFPELRRPAWNGGELAHVFRFGAWVTVSSVVSPVLVYLDRFMLGTLVSMAAVAYYTAPYELVSRLWIVPTSLVATLFPAFSTLSGRADWPRVEALAARSIKYVLMLVGTLALVVAGGASEILTLWLDPTFAARSTLALQVLAVGVLVNSVAHVPYSLVQGLGRADLTAKFHLLELPVQLALVWVCVSLWGIPGAALAWTVRVTLDAALLFGAQRRLTGLSVATLLAERVPQTALLLVLGGIAAVALSAVPGSPWLRLGGLVLIAAGVLGAVWRYSLAQTERDHLVRLLALSRAPQA